MAEHKRTDAGKHEPHALSLAFLNTWSGTQALWLASRNGGLPHEVATLLVQAHAAMDRAVGEAERAGLVEVERDAERRVVGIRAVEQEASTG